MAAYSFSFCEHHKISDYIYKSGTYNKTRVILTAKPFGPGRPMGPAEPRFPVEPAGPGLPSSPPEPWKELKKC